MSAPFRAVRLSRAKTKLGEDAGRGLWWCQRQARGRRASAGLQPAGACCLGRSGHLGPLPDLPRDVLVAVADALALVGLGRAALADVGGDLADQLLVDPAHDHL